VGVEGVDVLGALEPVDDEVGEWRSEDFVGDFKQVAFDNDEHEFVGGERPREHDRDDQRRVDELANDS